MLSSFLAARDEEGPFPYGGIVVLDGLQRWFEGGRSWLRKRREMCTFEEGVGTRPGESHLEALVSARTVSRFTAEPGVLFLLVWSGINRSLGSRGLGMSALVGGLVQCFIRAGSRAVTWPDRRDTVFGSDRE